MQNVLASEYQKEQVWELWYRSLLERSTIQRTGMTSAQIEELVKQSAIENGYLSASGEPIIYTQTVQTTGTALQTPMTVTGSADALELATYEVSPTVGYTVVTEVVPTVAAVAVGSQLGMAIDKAIYESNPEYWQENLPTLNPDTWLPTLIGNENARNYYDLRDHVANPVLYDMTHKKSYLNEPTLLYMTDFYASKIAGLPKEDDSVLSGVEIYIVGDPYNYRLHSSVDPGGAGRNDVYSNLRMPAGVNVFFYPFVNNTFRGIMFSATDLGSSHYTYDDLFEGQTYHVDYTVEPAGQPMYSYTFRGKTVYYSPVNFGGFIVENTFPMSTTMPLSIDEGKLAWIALYGAQELPEGYSQIMGDPILMNWYEYKKQTTNEGKLGVLSDTYPEWFSNGINLGTVAADGTVKNNLWLPVQLPTGFSQGANLGTASGWQYPDSSNMTQVFDGTYPGADIGAKALYESIMPGIANFPTYVPTVDPTIVKDTTPTFDPPTPNVPGAGINSPTTGTGSTPTLVVPPEDPDTGFGKVYIPTKAQVQALNNFLWSSTFSLDTLKKIFQDPIEAVIGLQQVYFNPTIAGTDEIHLGNVGTGVTSEYTNKRFYTLDCGYVNVEETFGNVFDYQSKVSCYLPFVGIVQLETSKIYRGEVNIRYDLDILSGAGNAKIYVNRDNYKALLYTYGCQIASQYPLTGSNHSSQLLGIGSMAVGAAASIMSGGAALPMVAGAIGGLNNMGTHIQQSGGYMGVGAIIHKKPYLIIEKPIPNMAKDYNEFVGYPFYKSVRLGECTGLTKCTEVHLDVNGISSLEKDLIMSELQKGVIL